MASTNDWTTDFQAIQCYDQLKVNAVLNWIDGKTHLGTSKAQVPAIFGMNFQAFSVGEKLILSQSIPAAPVNCAAPTICGGYTDAAGTPTASMESEFKFVDAAIGQMVEGSRTRTSWNRPPSSSPPSTANPPSIPTASSLFPATPP